MKKIIITSVIGGIILFMYSNIAWRVLPFHQKTITPLPDGEKAIAAMSLNSLPKGAYHYPGMPETSSKTLEEWQKRYKKGPNINLMFISPKGASMSAGPFIIYFFINMICTFIVAFCVSLSKEKLNSYLKKCGFVVLFGVFASLLDPITQWNWWQTPLNYELAYVFDYLVSWLLVGLVVAKIIK